MAHSSSADAHVLAGLLDHHDFVPPGLQGPDALGGNPGEGDEKATRLDGGRRQEQGGKPAVKGNGFYRGMMVGYSLSLVAFF